MGSVLSSHQRNTQFMSSEQIYASSGALPTQSAPQHELSFSAQRRHPLPCIDVTSRFGLRLRQLRQDRCLTQLRMAVEFGIDRTFISDLERGRKSISLPMLEVLALGFHLSLSELLQDI